jgi:hypothetical protein
VPRAQGKRVQVLDTDGGAPPARTGFRPVRDHYMNVPGLLKEYMEAQGRNLIPDSFKPEYMAMKAALGVTPVFLSELPDGNRDAIILDARKVGWMVKDDTLRYGDCCLCSQSDEERQYWEDQASAQWAFQTEDKTLVDSLTDAARDELAAMGGGHLLNTLRGGTITGGGAASHVAGGRVVRDSYPGAGDRGRGF